MWIPQRWGLTGFELAVFVLAAVRVVLRWRQSRGIGWHPVSLLLGTAVAWGLAQVAAGWSVDVFKTLEAVLDWFLRLTVFALALDLYQDAEARERFLDVTLIFATALSVAAMLTALTSPPGVVWWKFITPSDQPTLGPFLYRNQYAAFVEAVLPLAVLRSVGGGRRGIPYMLAAAVLFGSVVLGGSRTGVMLCLAEIVAIPALVFARGGMRGGALARATLGSLGAVAVFTTVAGPETVWRRLQEPNPYGLRWQLVQSSAEMVRERPWTGFGLGTWPTAYPGYARYDDGTFVNQAHNDWAQGAVEGGVPFLLLMLAVAAWCVRPALRSLWGIGMLAVFLHCLVDYPMQQRPALGAFFFAMLGTLLAGHQALRAADQLPGQEHQSSAQSHL